ncbi:MAG: GTP cyclohydrolase I FolE [Christensenellales bacterium]
MTDSQKIRNAVKDILIAIGEDPDREGLKETPDRVARMLEELTSGYSDDPSVHLSKTFEQGGSRAVIEKDIYFSSTCEHHLMPFFGKVHIAYIPDGKVVGLSKLARVVDAFARRLQLQERLNAQIADAIFDELAPKGVMVVVEGEHTCMTARGVKKFGSKTVTSAVRGQVPDDVKAMLFSAIGKRD